MPMMAMFLPSGPSLAELRALVWRAVYCERWRVGAPPDPRTGLSPTQNRSNVHPAFLCLSCGSQALEE